MDEEEMRRRVAISAAGALATNGPGGRPHIVPFVFALKGDTLYWTVDQKPKRSPDLQRLRNIRKDPRVAVLIDTYDENWARLWWVRLDGRARIVDEGDERERAVNALRGKYVQYREQPLDGTVVAIDVERWVGWPTP